MLSVAREWRTPYSRSHKRIRATPAFPSSDDHLCHALASKCLAANELLVLQSSQSVEGSCDERDNGKSDQAAGIVGDANPLDDRHDCVDCRPHVVGRHTSDQRIELGRGGAYTEEKWYLDEDEDEATCAAGTLVLTAPSMAFEYAYSRMILHIMRRLKWKMLAMPRANASIMQSTPVLFSTSANQFRDVRLSFGIGGECGVRLLRASWFA